MDEVLQRIAERWNKHAQSYDERHHGQRTLEEKKAWQEVLAHHLGQDTSVKVLDVGTGTGFLALLATELGFQCTGVDISTGMLAVAEQHAAAKALNINFLQGKAEDLPFPSGSFDVIINRSVLWTLLVPRVALTEWLRVLKPGGRLLCFHSEGKHGNNGNNHYSEDIENLLPLKGAPADWVVNMLVEAGYTAVEAVEVNGLTDGFADNVRKWYVIKGEKPIA